MSNNLPPSSIPAAVESTAGLLREGRPLNIFLGVLALVVGGSYYQQHKTSDQIYEVLQQKDDNTQVRYDRLQQHSFEVDKSLLKLLIEMTRQLQAQTPTKLDAKAREQFMKNMETLTKTLRSIEQTLPVAVANYQQLEELSLRVESLLLRTDGKTGR